MTESKACGRLRNMDNKTPNSNMDFEVRIRVDERTLSILENLAHSHGLSNAAMVRLLIHEEHERIAAKV